MKSFSKNLVVLVSLAFAAAGCGGGSGEGDIFTEEQAVEATKLGLATYLAGNFFASLQLGGQSGEFAIEAECDGGGTTTFAGSMTVVSDTEIMVEMDASSSACGNDVLTIDGTLHFEGTIESFDISGSQTFSGDTLSGTCVYDVSATFSADGESIDLTGTACGQDVSGPLPMTELIPEVD